MFNILKIYIFYFVLVIPLLAQEDGGRPGEFLRYGIGGRALGMGRAYTALVDDATATYWNPAGLTENIATYLDKPEFLSRLSFSSSFLTLLANTHFSTFSLSANVSRRFAFGCTYLWLGTSDIEGWELLPGNVPRQTLLDYDFRNQAFLFSGAFRILSWPTIDIGITTKLIKNTVSHHDDPGFEYNGIDLGFRLHCRPFFQQFFFGFNWLNIDAIGKTQSATRLPATFNTGLGWRHKFNEDCHLLVALDVEKVKISMYYLKHFNSYLRLGAEYQLNRWFAFRWGINRNEIIGGMGITLNSSRGKLVANPSMGYFLKISGFKNSWRGDLAWQGQPTSAIKWYEKAIMDISDKDFSGATYILNKILDEYIGTKYEILSYARIGDIQFYKKNDKSAYQYYSKFKEKINEHKKTLKDSIFQSQKIYTNRYENETEFLRCLKSFRNHIKVCQNLVYRNNDVEQDLVKVTIQFYEELLKNGLDDWDANYFAAVTYFITARTLDSLGRSKKNNYWEYASEKFKILVDTKNYPVSLEPLKPVFRLNLGICYIHTKTVTSDSIFNNLIKEDLKYSIVQDPLGEFIYPDSSLTDDLQFYLGDYFLSRNRQDDAIREYAKVLLFYPESDQGINLKENLRKKFNSENEDNLLNSQCSDIQNATMIDVDTTQFQHAMDIAIDGETLYVIEAGKGQYYYKNSPNETFKIEKIESLKYPFRLSVHRQTSPSQVKHFLFDYRQKSIIHKNDGISFSTFELPDNKNYLPIAFKYVHPNFYFLNFQQNNIHWFNTNSNDPKNEKSVQINGKKTTSKITKTIEEVKLPYDFAVDSNKNCYIGNFDTFQIHFKNLQDESEGILIKPLNKYWFPLRIIVSDDNKYLFILYQHLLQVCSIITCFQIEKKEYEHLKFDNTELRAVCVKIEENRDFTLWCIESGKNKRIKKYRYIPNTSMKN